MGVRWEKPYPPMPTRYGRTSKKRDSAGIKEEQVKLRTRLAGWLRRWGADLLLIWGAGCVCAGVGWIYPPAGLIAAGVLLIAGGVLWARGGDGP